MPSARILTLVDAANKFQAVINELRPFSESEINALKNFLVALYQTQIVADKKEE